ncbi:MAG: LamG domain-containing protein, partial [Acidimicrobiales bacterium]
MVFSTLAIVASLFAAVTVAGEAPASAARTPGEVVRYDFTDGAGTTVADSGSGAPLDLTVADPGNVTWVPGGGLTVDASTTIGSPGAASKVTSAIKATNEMTVEAWVTPAAGEQTGPARLVASSPNPNARNFMLAQGAYSNLPDDVFASRFRTTTSFTGTPTMFTPAGTANPTLTHIVLTRSTSDIQTLYVNGVQEASSTIAGTTANWDNTYPLTLANIADGSRPWTGTLCLVAVYDSALSASNVGDNYEAGCNPTPNVDPVLGAVAN